MTGLRGYQGEMYIRERESWEGVYAHTRATIHEAIDEAIHEAIHATIHATILEAIHATIHAA